MGCDTEIVVKADRSLGHSILRGRLGSGIDNDKIFKKFPKNIIIVI